MIVYWSMVALPAFFALGERRQTGDRTLAVLIFATILGLWIILASRETGGDYSTYLILFKQIESMPAWQAMLWTEPLYGLLNWASAQLRWGMYGVNAVCGILFFYGLWRFVRLQPVPYLMLAISVPYLVIVVAMGYTRQGVATGLIMLGMSFLLEKRHLLFLGAIVVATGFHNSAAIAVPLMLTADMNIKSKLLGRFVKLAIFLAGLVGLWMSVSSSFDTYVEAYVESDRYSSGGAVLRTAVTAAAALMFFYYRSRWKERFSDYRMFFWLSVVSLALIPLSFIQSTAADRIGLYLIPFQVAVMARLPVLQRREADELLMKIGVLSAYLLYFFTWLHLGSYARVLWLPYQSGLF